MKAGKLAALIFIGFILFSKQAFGGVDWVLSPSMPPQTTRHSCQSNALLMAMTLAYSEDVKPKDTNSFYTIERNIRHHLLRQLTHFNKKVVARNTIKLEKIKLSSDLTDYPIDQDFLDDKKRGDLYKEYNRLVKEANKIIREMFNITIATKEVLLDRIITSPNRDMWKVTVEYFSDFTLKQRRFNSEADMRDFIRENARVLVPTGDMPLLSFQLPIRLLLTSVASINGRTFNEGHIIGIIAVAPHRNTKSSHQSGYPEMLMTNSFIENEPGVPGYCTQYSPNGDYFGKIGWVKNYAFRPVWGQNYYVHWIE